MLTRCYADNYRCLSSFDLQLEPLTVLLGPNGSGKSTLLDLIAHLRDFILGRESSTKLFPSETLTRWDQRREQTFELAVRLDRGNYLYRLRISHRPEQELNKVIEEKLSVDAQPLFVSTDQQTLVYNDRNNPGLQLQPDWHISGISRVHERPDNTKLWAFRRFIEGMLVLAPNPAAVTAVAAGKLPVTLPKPDCSDFAAWLRYVSNSVALARQEMEQNLKTELPGFRVFQAERSGDAEILQCIFQSGSIIKQFRLDELSSGQVALIILETAIAVVGQQRGALLLDEPSNFLGLSEIHPLLTRLQDAALEGRYQVILSAHHPVAVNFLAAAHGLWLEREPIGPTRVSRIHVDRDIAEGKAGVSVSDLVARGWLSGLGTNLPDATAKP
ncbi:MAG: AAA family ATPase [Candidatus Sulfotelmatobacter sp.]